MDTIHQLEYFRQTNQAPTKTHGSENSDVFAQQTNNLSSGMLYGSMLILLSPGVERLSPCYSGHIRQRFAAHNRLSPRLARRLSSCAFARRHTLRHRYAAFLCDMRIRSLIAPGLTHLKKPCNVFVS